MKQITFYRYLLFIETVLKKKNENYSCFLIAQKLSKYFDNYTMYGKWLVHKFSENFNSLQLFLNYDKIRKSFDDKYLIFALISNVVKIM